jgi:small conductance mechanosensitive channel
MPDAPAAAETTTKIADDVGRALTPVSRIADHATDWFAARGPSLVGSLLLFAAAWLLAKWARRLVIAALDRAHIDTLLAKFFGNLVRWAIIVFAGVSCLGTLGIETTSLAAIIGAMGLAVGLALQGNLGNLAAGVLLLVFRPFKIGDSVVVSGMNGVIDGIDLFTTNLDTPDGRRIIVPNSSIFGGVIENQSHHPRRPVTVSVPVAATADLDRTHGALMAAVQATKAAVPGIENPPAPTAVLTEINPVTWAVTVWCAGDALDAVKPVLLRELKLAIDREGLA